MPIRADQDVNALRMILSTGAVNSISIQPSASVTAITSTPTAKTWS